MIPKTKIEEAAKNLAQKWCEEDNQPASYQHTHYGFIHGAKWAIAEIEKTASVGFREWVSFLECDHVGHTYSKQAWIACSLAKDKEISELRSTINHYGQCEQERDEAIDKIQSLKSQLKELEIKVLHFSGELNIRNNQAHELEAQLKERDEALIDLGTVINRLEIFLTKNGQYSNIIEKHRTLIDKIKGSK